MKDEIVNRVAQSALITFDIEDLYVQGNRIEIDMSQWLEQGFILREKEFRSAITSFDWSIYQDHFIALNCSTDAILPAWASLLVTAQLNKVSQTIVWGTLSDLEYHLFVQAIDKLDLSDFEGKPVIVKGCSEKQIPESAYIYLIQKLQPVVKSLFYGEACSSVPLYKR
ncbi:MAG: DUF2480 family protein [Flavobacteriaceae bacterium]|nr:DUF2480 family protein [Flavobacteriaceae bacterium]